MGPVLCGTDDGRSYHSGTHLTDTLVFSHGGIFFYPRQILWTVINMKKWFRYGLSGAAAGIVNGLFGAGGGMVLVPLLIRFGQLEDKKAFSSAISIILPMCLVSIAVYWTKQVFPIREALPYLLGGLAGGILGGVLFRNVSAHFLHKIFGLVILWGGVRLLF